MSDAVELSEREKEAYRELSELFKLSEASTERDIRFYEDLAQLLKEDLRKKRPVVPGASRFCKKCRIISMRYVGSVPEETRLGAKDSSTRRFTLMDGYRCLVCGDYEEEPSATEF